MCIIIDNNVVRRVLCVASDDVYGPVGDKLNRSQGRAVLHHGGRLTREYILNTDVRKRLLELERRGRARKHADKTVDAEEINVSTAYSLRSDDPHIIALAIVSGARLLVTEDVALIVDFKDSAILKPKGSVYSQKANKELLRKMC